MFFMGYRVLTGFWGLVLRASYGRVAFITGALTRSCMQKEFGPNPALMQGGLGGPLHFRKPKGLREMIHKWGLRPVCLCRWELLQELLPLLLLIGEAFPSAHQLAVHQQACPPRYHLSCCTDLVETLIPAVGHLLHN